MLDFIPSSQAGRPASDLLVWAQPIGFRILIQNPEQGWLEELAELLRYPELVAASTMTEKRGGWKMKMFIVRPGDNPNGRIVEGGVMEEWLLPLPRKLFGPFGREFLAALQLIYFARLISDVAEICCGNNSEPHWVTPNDLIMRLHSEGRGVVGLVWDYGSAA